MDGILLELEVRLVREEELEAARHAARHALVLRDVRAPVRAGTLPRLGIRAGLLLLGSTRGFALGPWFDEAALHGDLLGALGVAGEALVDGARQLSLTTSNNLKH